MAGRKKAESEALAPEQELEADVVKETAPVPGTVLKEYVQNGMRYKRVVAEKGGTVDVRA